MSTETTEFSTFEELTGESNVDDFATFDNMEDVEEDETVEEKPVKEKVKDDLKIIKDSSTDSEGKVIKEDKEESEEESEESEDEEENDKKKSKKEKKEDEEDKEEKSEDEEEEAKELEKKAKSKLRIKMADGLYNIDPDSTIRVKVDGENQDVPVQELINNYSGKVAYDAKFNELKNEKKEVETLNKNLKAEQSRLLEFVNTALSPLKDNTKNPMDSLLYLVEMSGEDPYNAYKRLIESNLKEVDELLNMNETERQLYFMKKKDELHGNMNKKRQERLASERNFNQTVQKVDELRKSYNVSEDEFVEASEEFETLLKDSGVDVNTITNEQIVEFASLKPHIAKVKTLLEPFEDNVPEGKYGDEVAKFSRALRNKELEEKEVAEILKRRYSVEEDVKELNTKVYKQKEQKARKPAQEETKGFESFDDWD